MRGRRSTPAGQHQPVLLEHVLAVLDPRPDQVIVDCTVGWAGHAVELLQRIGPQGLLIGLDLDPDNLPRARERLESLAFPFRLCHGNFAGLPALLQAEGVSQVDGLIADLGMSSMQVDDPERGFSYVRDGPLDMRMDRSRGQTAAAYLARVNESELAQGLAELGDEPDAERIARAIVVAREANPLQRTSELARVIAAAVGETSWQLHPRPGKWNLHPAARTFQALRILVNRELASLNELLRILPGVLKPGGTGAVISFHSGEDRRVKSAFRTGKQSGIYSASADDPVRANPDERLANPRSRSAKLRWAKRMNS